MVLCVIFLLGCAPLPKITGYAANAVKSRGPTTPPVDHIHGGEKFFISPSTASFSLTKTSETFTLTAKEKFVFKDVFFCKAPCGGAHNWQKVGEFSEQPVSGRYVNGQNGVTTQITLNRDDISDGDNYFVTFTCIGKGKEQCNNNKWVMQKFTATFPGCPVDCTPKKCDAAAQKCVDCLVETDCSGGKKCNPTTKTCVECVDDTHCPGKKCDTTTKTCVTTCTGVPCPIGQQCNPADGKCVQCIVDKNVHKGCAGYFRCINNNCVSCSKNECSECEGKQDNTPCLFGTCLSGKCRFIAGGVGGMTLVTAAISSSPITNSVSKGATTLIAPDAPRHAFRVGDDVMIHQTRVDTVTQEAQAGQYEFNIIVSINSDGLITLEKPLQKTYSSIGNARAQIVRPLYENWLLKSGAVMTVHPWDGHNGGILFIKSDVLTIESGAKIDLVGKGFLGGNNGGCHDNQQGESFLGGLGVSQNNVGGGGGGGHHIDYKASSSGGGGGYGTGGANGLQDSQSGPYGQSGGVYGVVDLSRINLGSGGGGGGGGCYGGGSGGAGGGIIFIDNREVTVNGIIDASGAAGSNGNDLDARVTEAAGGGGGSGGSIFIQGRILTVPVQNVFVAGGLGGRGEAWNTGGVGGQGRYFIKSPCTTDSDCLGTAKKCHSAKGCVQCLTTTDCSSNIPCKNNMCTTNPCAGDPDGKLCSGGSCISDVCKPVCPSGMTLCSGNCVDTASNSLNCGRCDTVCPTTKPFCRNSVCGSGIKRL